MVAPLLPKAMTAEEWSPPALSRQAAWCCVLDRRSTSALAKFRSEHAGTRLHSAVDGALVDTPGSPCRGAVADRGDVAGLSNGPELGEPRGTDCTGRRGSAAGPAAADPSPAVGKHAAGRSPPRRAEDRSAGTAGARSKRRRRKRGHRCGASSSTAAAQASTVCSGNLKSKLLESEGGNLDSENAVKRGLGWLAAHQLASGAWRFNHQGPPCSGACGNPGNEPSTTASTCGGPAMFSREAPDNTDPQRRLPASCPQRDVLSLAGRMQPDWRTAAILWKARCTARAVGHRGWPKRMP